VVVAVVCIDQKASRWGAEEAAGGKPQNCGAATVLWKQKCGGLEV
jgi:hypothetical protein